MKCSQCGTDADYRARQATHRCANCGRRFAFEPRRDRSVTDLMFRLAIEAVSDDGRLSWIDDHLYYDVCRRVRRRRFLHRLLRRPIVSVDRGTFELLLDRWVETHGPPPGRLVGRAFTEDERALPPRADAPLGFESLVVCHDDAIADVLLVNGFHADYKCPVLSRRGYPAHVYDALMPRLRDSPPTTLVVIHSADWEGCRLAGEIADDPRWFAGVELPKVIDAGLRPGDAPRFRGLYEPAASGFDASSPGVLPAEAKWLRTYRLGLGAARPRVLMGVLAKVLRGESDSPSDGDLFPIWAGDAWSDGDDEVG